MSTPTLDANNVVIGTANGVGLLFAPVGTAKPSTTTEDWPAGWETLGYVHEDGLTISKEIETEQIKAWQSQAPLRTVVTGKTLSLGMTLIELTPRSAGVYFGEEVPEGTDDDFTLQVTTSGAPPEYAYALDVKDGDSAVRVIIGRGTLAESGEVPVKAAEAMGLPITIDALDEDGILATIIRGAAAVAS